MLFYSLLPCTICFVASQAYFYFRVFILMSVVFVKCVHFFQLVILFLISSWSVLCEMSSLKIVLGPYVMKVFLKLLIMNASNTSSCLYIISRFPFSFFSCPLFPNIIATLMFTTYTFCSNEERFLKENYLCLTRGLALTFIFTRVCFCDSIYCMTGLHSSLEKVVHRYLNS